jgi:undecaprenyl-diphosphatase
MSLWEAILLGIIQGLTEFIPISSTAHLTLAGKSLGLIDPEHPEKWTAFMAVIQLGTLVAVVWYFWKDLLAITHSFVRHAVLTMRGRAGDMDSSIVAKARLGWLVILGTLPIAVVGVALKDLIEGRLTKNLWVIAFSVLGLALLLTAAELLGRRDRDFDRLKASDALIVGFAQVLALVPGSSRSGVTITGALFSGLTREAAARFSFLLSIPAIAASGVFELPAAMDSVKSDWPALVAATVVSAISGYLSIAFLLRYLRTHTTFLFVGYRVILGLLLLGLLAWGRLAAY